MKLRTLWESVKTADDVRSLFMEAAQNSLQRALREFAKLVGDEVPWALIGGLAIGYHVEPRGTDDIDILLPDEDSVEAIVRLTAGKFKRNRSHAITHTATGVEVEMLTATFLKLDPSLVRSVLASSVVANGVRLADVNGLIALKLTRWALQDRADIEKLVKMHGHPNLAGFGLSPELVARFEQFVRDQNL
jgi:hypothetical protein